MTRIDRHHSAALVEIDVDTDDRSTRYHRFRQGITAARASHSRSSTFEPMGRSAEASTFPNLPLRFGWQLSAATMDPGFLP